MYRFYFKSLKNVPQKLVDRYMYKDNHCVYVKEFKVEDDKYILGIFNINAKGEEYLDNFEVPKESVHHFENV